MSKKANILIIVLFIMFLSSLSWLLVTKYVKNMINYSSEFLKYYKWYYLANAWIELELTKIKNHWFGFEDRIMSGSDTNQENFQYCWERSCFFESSIVSRSKIVSTDSLSWDISSCSNSIAFPLRQWRGLIVPLFYDKNIWEGTLFWINNKKISDSQFNNISLNFYQANWEYYSLGVSDSKNKEFLGSSENFTTNFSNPEFNWFYNPSKKSFLVIANTENSKSLEKVCIKSSLVELPLTKIKIKSIGKYFDRYVSIEGEKSVKLPDYLIYNIIDN